MNDLSSVLAPSIENPSFLANHSILKKNAKNYLLQELHPQWINKGTELRFLAFKHLLLKNLPSPILPIEDMQWNSQTQVPSILYSLPEDFESFIPLSQFIETLISDTEKFSLLAKIIQQLYTIEQVKHPLYPQGLYCSPFLPQQFFIHNKTQETFLINFFLKDLLFEEDKCSWPQFYFQYETWAQNQKPHIQTYNYNWLYPSNFFKNYTYGLKESIYSLCAWSYFALTQKFPIALTQEDKPHLPKHWISILDQGLGTKCDSFNDLLRHIPVKKKPPTPQKDSWKNLIPPKNMVLIAYNEKVILGSNENALNEKPAFKAKVSPFFIDRFLITNQQFETFNPQHLRSPCSSGDLDPVVLISYHMAQAYCDWRSLQENLPVGSYRLPNEYEWEAAARGVAGSQYPWDEEHLINSSDIHCEGSSNGKTINVHSGKEGRNNLYHMLGNVWEWTSSKYKAHPMAATSSVSYNLSIHVIKGGYWGSPIEGLRASLREAFSPFQAKETIGFRCVKDLPSP